jgi:hypothetical protein
MKPILPLCLLLAAATLHGQALPVPAPAAPADPISVEQILLELERDWSQADIHKDAAALDRILAEDWIGIDFEGTVLTKSQALEGLASDSGSLETTVLRDMKVRIYGNTAIITGSDTEKSEYHGKDSSGKYLWTDVFVLRNGLWQAVSSQSTKLTEPSGPKELAGLDRTGGGSN